MDVFNKLKQSVSGSLPGNPVFKEFDVGKVIGSGGPSYMWKIHSAVKKSTKQAAAVWVFDKKQVDKYDRQFKEMMLNVFKQGISQLTRLKHPRILSVLHPLEESKDCFAFATESVFASLGNVLGETKALPAVVQDQLDSHELFDVEIKFGVLQVAEAVNFLHTSAKMLHSNLAPESLVLTQAGEWKVAGFDFSVTAIDPNDANVTFPFRDYESSLPAVMQPNLDYLAPEYARTLSCSPASDLFSLGVVLHAIYNGGKPLFRCMGDYGAFRTYVAELQGSMYQLGDVPVQLVDHAKLLVNTEPSVRPDADQLMKIPFFEDVGVMTLQFLNTLFQRDYLQRSKFFKGLPQILPKLPKRVCLLRILPHLHGECVNKDMIPFVLLPILLVAKQCSKQEFSQYILPVLVPIFKLTQPIQIPLLLLQNMSLLLEKTPADQVKQHVLPMTYRVLEAGSAQTQGSEANVQEICLDILPTFANLIDYTPLKTAVVPRIKKLCLQTSTLTLRVKCLLCLGQLLEYMDKWFVQDHILPFLKDIPSREPAVLMSILGIVKVAFSHDRLGISREVLSAQVLPFLIPLSAENTLNLAQFKGFMGTIRDMLDRLEAEQTTKLTQLQALKD